MRFDTLFSRHQTIQTLGFFQSKCKWSYLFCSSCMHAGHVFSEQGQVVLTNLLFFIMVLCLCSSQYDKVQDGVFPSTHFSLADSLHGAFANSIHELTLNSFSLKTYRMIFHKHVKILFTIRKHMCAVLTPQKYILLYIHTL